jgi:N-ethylmaleimide reductase
MNHHKLFNSFNLFDLELKNRIVMAPLTRCRADIGDVALNLQAEYYSQRATAGLIISEASQISQQGKGYAHTPGIYSKQQIEGWKLTTDSVHQHKGRIFCQLWHVGRISHPDLQPGRSLPVAPSAIKPKGFALTEQGPKEFVTPRALELDEIPGIIEQYIHAAKAAKEAGFDGVEIHAANGYLLDQFIRSSTNHRTDSYGETIANRIRLTIEVTQALCEIWPSHQIGIRLSPISSFNEMSDASPFETFSALIKELNKLNVAYIHCIEGTARDTRPQAHEFDFIALRKLFNGYYIANNLYNLEMAEKALDKSYADLICFGRPFIGNPDLVHRLQNNLPLVEAPNQFWYGGNEKGYTDWPNYV